MDKLKCGCYKCLSAVNNDNGFPLSLTTFIVCPLCGNKRCPRATDHALPCTGSNEVGQKGSRYE
jgi:hypothetical protein